MNKESTSNFKRLIFGHDHSSDSGYFIVEIILSVMIFSVLALWIIRLVSNNYQVSHTSQSIVVANQVASGVIEDFKRELMDPDSFVVYHQKVSDNGGQFTHAMASATVNNTEFAREAVFSYDAGGGLRLDAHIEWLYKNKPHSQSIGCIFASP